MTAIMSRVCCSNLLLLCMQIFVLSSSRIQQRGYDTLFNYTTANPKSGVSKFVKQFPLKSQVWCNCFSLQAPTALSATIYTLHPCRLFPCCQSCQVCAIQLYHLSCQMCLCKSLPCSRSCLQAHDRQGPGSCVFWRSSPSHLLLQTGWRATCIWQCPFTASVIKHAQTI